MNENVEDIVSIATDFGEIALDSIMDDGILKDIPIVGNVVKVLKLGKSVTDSVLLYKIKMFVNNLEFKSQEEIDDFKSKYLKIEDYQSIGSKIILFLNSADDEKKIKWLSKLLKIYVDKKINKQDFLRLTMIINNSFPDYIESLLYFKDKTEILSDNNYVEQYILEHLYSIGCLSYTGFDGGEVKEHTAYFESGNRYSLTKFGKILLDYII